MPKLRKAIALELINEYGVVIWDVVDKMYKHDFEWDSKKEKVAAAMLQSGNPRLPLAKAEKCDRIRADQRIRRDFS